MTEPYLEVLNGGQILRVNTSCPFVDMMNPGSYLYLPNAVDIDAGMIKDGMAIIPLDPERNNHLMIQFPMEQDSVRMVDDWYSLPYSVECRRLGFSTDFSTADWISFQDETLPTIELPDFIQRLEEYNENIFVSFFPRVGNVPARCIVIVPYFLEGGKEYQVVFNGRCWGSSKDNPGCMFFDGQGNLVGKVSSTTHVNNQNKKFTTERSGIYAVAWDIAIETDTHALWANAELYWQRYALQESIHYSPWAQMQYVTGMASYIQEYNQGNYNLNITNYPFRDEEPEFESKIGYIWLYPSRFDNFIQYGEIIV